MAIGINAAGMRMSARALALPGEEAAGGRPAAGGFRPPGIPSAPPSPPPAPSAPPAPPGPSAPAAPPAPPPPFAEAPSTFAAATSFPSVATLATVALPPRDFPRVPLPLPPLPLPPAQMAPKTTTQLARGAIALLNSANPAAVREAANAIINSRLEGPALMTFLERKTPIRTVMESLARDWNNDTRTDFANAFNMSPESTDAMDAIVSLAILNDGDLQEELLAENIPAPTLDDLMARRTVVFQFPPGGTRLEPPYTTLLAVDYRDVATAQEVVNSILGELGNFREKLRMPKSVIPRLG